MWSRTTGLNTRPTHDLTVAELDFDQNIAARMALARALATVVGGEGILTGGARVIGDLTDGATYPAATLVLADDSGEFWFFQTPSTPIDVSAVTTGTAYLYAIIKLSDRETPTALGSNLDVRFVALDSTATAPTHSLRLGSGSFSTGAFTSYSEATGVRRDARKIGTGKDTVISLLFDNGATNPAGIRYDPTTDKLQYSHDGSTWSDLGTGGGGGGSTTLAGLTDVSLGSPSGNQFLRYNASTGKWTNQTVALGSTTLTGLTDVGVTSVLNDQFLRFDSATGKWVNRTVSVGGSTTLAGLTDVGVTSPTDDQILRFDTVSGKWVNRTLTIDPETALAALTDVAVSSPTDNQFLRYDTASGKWVNETVAVGGAGTEFSVAGDTGTAPVIGDTDVLSLIGAENGFKFTGDAVGDSLTLDMMLAADRPGLEKGSDGYGGVGWRVTRPLTQVGIPVVFDGGGSAIGTGAFVDVEVPFDCAIERVTLLADQSGSIVVDLRKDTYANFPPAAGDSICASAKPTISSAAKSQDATLTGWSKTLTRGDIIRFYVESCTTIQRCTVSLLLVRG